MFRCIAESLQSDSQIGHCLGQILCEDLKAGVTESGFSVQKSGHRVATGQVLPKCLSGHGISDVLHEFGRNLAGINPNVGMEKYSLQFHWDGEIQRTAPQGRRTYKTY